MSQLCSSKRRLAGWQADVPKESALIKDFFVEYKPQKIKYSTSTEAPVGDIRNRASLQFQISVSKGAR